MAEDMQISLTSPNGIKLKTANTLVDRDIKIIPTLEELDINGGGTFTPSDGFVGFKKVSVSTPIAWKYFEGGFSEIILNDVTKLKDYAFYNDTAIQRITMLKLQSIGKYAFSGCTSLAQKSLPNNVTQIDNYAFYNCKKLALTSLPEELYGIEESAFYNCILLEISRFSDKLHHIQKNCFYGCTNLKTLSFPSGINISNFAFSNCSALTEITFRGTAAYISSSAFSNCTKLTSINVPWAKGEVANAPWGASSESIINYNYTGD